jgi:PilZ domain
LAPLHDVEVEIKDASPVLPVAHQIQRRSVRYKLDVPLRVILQHSDRTLIRGTEISECGMCVMAGLELKIGDSVEIEFTPPYSGEPIRVTGAVRYRDGYRYGCEFMLDGQGERKDVARLRQVLQTFAGEGVS